MRKLTVALLFTLLCPAALAQPPAPVTEQPSAPAVQPSPPTTVPQPEKVLLQLKLAPGQVLRYRGYAEMNGTMNMAMTGAPQQGQQPMNMQMMFGGKGNAAATAKVVKKDAYGGARLSVRLDNLGAAVDAMGQKIQMSFQKGKFSMSVNGQPMSKEKMPNMAGKQAIPFLQKPIEVKIGKRGQLMDIVVPGMEKEWKQMMAQVKQMYGGMDPMTLMRQTQILLPDHPIAVGEGWNQHVEVPLAGGPPVVVDMNFTLDNLETVNGKQIATLGVTGRQTMTNMDLGAMMKQGMAQSGGTMPQMPPIAGRMNGEFGISGKAKFNVTAGTLDRYDFRADINFRTEGGMPMGPPGQKQQQMSMTMDMTGQINGALARQ